MFSAKDWIDKGSPALESFKEANLFACWKALYLNQKYAEKTNWKVTDQKWATVFQAFQDACMRPWGLKGLSSMTKIPIKKALKINNILVLLSTFENRRLATLTLWLRGVFRKGLNFSPFIYWLWHAISSSKLCASSFKNTQHKRLGKPRIRSYFRSKRYRFSSFTGRIYVSFIKLKG